MLANKDGFYGNEAFRVTIIWSSLGIMTLTKWFVECCFVVKAFKTDDPRTKLFRTRMSDNVTFSFYIGGRSRCEYCVIFAFIH